MARTRGAKSGRGSGGEGMQGNAAGFVTLFVGALVTGYLFVTNSDPKGFEIYNLINTGLCLWLPLMVILLILRHSPEEYGLGIGDSRLGYKWALILWGCMLPAVLIAASLPDFRNQYLSSRLSQYLFGVGPVFGPTGVNLKALLYYELVMGFYMFCWEFFFRGFLLFGLLKTRLGTWGAVIIQALPFVLLHWALDPRAAKPILEVIGSFPAAIILGVLALRTRSILYGFLAHWAVSVTMDLTQLAPFIFRHFG